MFYDPQRDFGGRRLEGLQLMDIAPTILDLMGLPVPADMQGSALQPDRAAM
jgi:arylsulfatase A-like enzyme